MFGLPFFKKTSIGPRGEQLPLPNEGLPDSNNPGGLCPRCNKQSSFEITGFMPVTFDGGVLHGSDGRKSPTYSERVSVLVCRHCKQGVVVIEEEYVGDLPSKQQSSGGSISHRGFHWWPLPNIDLSSDIPKEIAGAFSEAATALLADCPRASAVMARRTIEAIAVDKGQNTGSLAQRLSKLGSEGILHPTLIEWTKEVRLIGNQGAHFDLIDTVSKEDAQQLLDFIRELLKFLYELPAELNRRRKH